MPSRRALRRVPQVGEVRGCRAARCIRRAPRRPSGAAAAADCARVLDGTLEIVAEALLAPGQAGGAALAERASPGGMLCSTTSTRASRAAAAMSSGVIRTGTGIPPRGSRRARPREAIEERTLGEQHREVGGELRHNASIAEWKPLPPLVDLADRAVRGELSHRHRRGGRGIGGGVLFVPIVASFFPFHLDFVRGAGLVFALAGTLAAGPMLLRNRMASLRLVMPLALAGSIASVAGAVVGLSMPTDALQTALGATVIAIAVLIAASKDAYGQAAIESDALGAALRMRGDFEDPAAHARIDWRTHRTLAGFGAFGAIGFLGGLFGLGAGFANVPALNLLMAAPLKVAVGSSGLTISIINSSAAWVYINRGARAAADRGAVDPRHHARRALGARLLRTLPATVRRVVIVAMLMAGVRALLRGSACGSRSRSRVYARWLEPHGAVAFVSPSRVRALRVWRAAGRTCRSSTAALWGCRSPNTSRAAARRSAGLAAAVARRLPEPRGVACSP
jgi:uncharacterized membrane protein YfcA